MGRNLGYMLMGSVLPYDSGLQAILFYHVVYGFMNLGAFLVVIALSAQTRREDFEHYRGLGWRMPLLAVPMAFFMFSLTGVPPVRRFRRQGVPLSSRDRAGPLLSLRFTW